MTEAFVSHSIIMAHKRAMGVQLQSCSLFHWLASFAKLCACNSQKLQGFILLNSVTSHNLHSNSAKVAWTLDSSRFETGHSSSKPHVSTHNFNPPQSPNFPLPFPQPPSIHNNIKSRNRWNDTIRSPRTTRKTTTRLHRLQRSNRRIPVPPQSTPQTPKHPKTKQKNRVSDNEFHELTPHMALTIEHNDHPLSRDFDMHEGIYLEVATKQN